MKIRLLILLSALLVLLLEMTSGLRAQQQQTDPAARRVIVFVWDGLRTDDLTPDITPNISRWPDRASSLRITTPSTQPSR
jgi:predicted AlkP superfamily pyrophosphatase or phosphodiesterase